ncbi:hypothetical protein ACFV7Q_31490 [Streptomyces sp. NPDC059851]|uniref:hypothetical protein n=1 Tax=Streptomyces sp. NPDC059851 TaxID=3346971 RepID=UPI00365372BE
MAKMVADGVPALGWLRWLSPFGLTALTRPYGGARIWPLLLLATAGVALAVAAVLASGRRDIRGGSCARLPAGPRG